jgi:elongation factor P hydroxylase
LRARFIQIVGDFLQRAPVSATRAARETFYFCASESVVIPANFVANTLKEFAEGLRGVTVHCIHHHFIEARLRLKLMSNDFSQWLYEDMGLTEAARQLNRIDIYTMTLEDVRNQIIRIVERALI